MATPKFTIRALLPDRPGATTAIGLLLEYPGLKDSIDTLALNAVAKKVERRGADSALVAAVKGATPEQKDTVSAQLGAVVDAICETLTVLQDRVPDIDKSSIGYELQHMAIRFAMLAMMGQGPASGDDTPAVEPLH